MATKTKEPKAVNVDQVWREVKTGRQLRVVGMDLDAETATCTYRLGTTGRFTAITEAVSFDALRSRKYVLIR